MIKIKNNIQVFYKLTYDMFFSVPVLPIDLSLIK